MTKRFLILLGIVLLVSPRARADQMDEALSFYKQGKYQEAINAFESCLANESSRSDRRTLYLYMGKSYESAGRLDKAVSAYEEALEYDRKNWRRHRDLGGLYEKTELIWKALDSYKKANRLAPKEPALFLAMGRAYRKVGLYSDALIWANKAVAVDQHDEGVQSELSRIYEGQGRFKEAAVAASKSDKTGNRLVYLSILAGDADLTKQGMALMVNSGGAKETRQVYENLVELLKLPPKEILAAQTPNSALQAILKSPFTEGTK